MVSSASLLLGYLLFILPAGLLALVLLVALPRALAGARLGVHILFFIFARDAMSPAGFWQLGAGSMRLTAPAPVLLALAGMSAALFVGVAWLERATWCKGLRIGAALLWGTAGAAVITVVAAALKAAAGLPSLPMPDASTLVPVLVFALLGNAYEELLFRGMLQQRLMARMTAGRAAIVSGGAVQPVPCVARDVRHAGGPAGAGVHADRRRGGGARVRACRPARRDAGAWPGHLRAGHRRLLNACARPWSEGHAGQRATRIPALT